MNTETARPATAAARRRSQKDQNRRLRQEATEAPATVTVAPTRKHTPIRHEDVTTEDGTVRSCPVLLLTCQETGEKFEHRVEGRGRPPLYSPEVRARREAEAAAPTPRKQSALGRIALLEGQAPEVGEYVMRIATGVKNATPWMVPARVLELLDGQARVERTYDGVEATVQLDKLVPIEVR